MARKPRDFRMQLLKGKCLDPTERDLDKLMEEVVNLSLGNEVASECNAIKLGSIYIFPILVDKPFGVTRGIVHRQIYHSLSLFHQ